MSIIDELAYKEPQELAMMLKTKLENTSPQRHECVAVQRCCCGTADTLRAVAIMNRTLNLKLKISKLLPQQTCSFKKLEALEIV